jgi:long-chain acyl-CoA synthetase
MPISAAPLADPVALTDLLRAGLGNGGDEDAVVSLERRWSFNELDTASSRLAAGYRALGLSTGDRVASLMPNRGALIVHYLACIKGGFVSVPLNYRYTPVEMAHALEVSEASALLHHAEREGDIAGCAAARSLRFGTIGYSAGGYPSERRLEAMIESGQSAPDLPEPEQHPASPAFILFTSGSTGAAKGVTHSLSSMRDVVASAAAGLELEARDLLLPGSSMSHIGGMLFSFAALSMGARVAVARSFVPEEIVPLIRMARPTVLCMLPAALFCLIRDGQVTREDFASLRLVRSGSDKVPAELEIEFEALAGLPIDEGYGCTEIGLATLNPPDRIVAGSIGRALPGFEFSIRDETGAELPAGKEGTLWVRSGSTMTGYWRDPAASAAVMNGAWFNTGDIMSADEEGYLRFCGRKKQIIVHDGSNIFPQEVEDALLLHPDVAAAGVIGIHDLVHGERVRAYVVRKHAARASEVELIGFAREQVGYKAPEEIEFLSEMPLNPTGKTDRVRLKAMAEARHAPAP